MSLYLNIISSLVLLLNWQTLFALRAIIGPTLVSKSVYKSRNRAHRLINRKPSPSCSHHTGNQYLVGLLETLRTVAVGSSGAAAGCRAAGGWAEVGMTSWGLTCRNLWRRKDVPLKTEGTFIQTQLGSCPDCKGIKSQVKLIPTVAKKAGEIPAMTKSRQLAAFSVSSC